MVAGEIRGVRKVTPQAWPGATRQDSNSETGTPCHQFARYEIATGVAAVLYIQLQIGVVAQNRFEQRAIDTALVGAAGSAPACLDVIVDAIDETRLAVHYRRRICHRNQIPQRNIGERDLPRI